MSNIQIKSTNSVQPVAFGSSGNRRSTKKSRLLRHLTAPRTVILIVCSVIIIGGLGVVAVRLRADNSRRSATQSPLSPRTSETNTGSFPSTTTDTASPKSTDKTPTVAVTPPTKTTPKKTTTTPSVVTPTAPSSPITAPPALSTGGYPDASTTGSSGTLTTVSGDVLLNTNGQVFANARVTGRITVDASNVIIRNVEVINNDDWVVLNYGANLTIEDSTLIGGNTTQSSVGDANSGYFVGRRLNISGAADGIKMGGGSRLYNSYIHDLATFAGAHNDGIEVNGPNVTISGNRIINKNDQTSAIFNISSNVLIDGNLLAGGGYTIYGGSGDGATNVRVTNNVFSAAYYTNSGFYGPSAYWPSSGVWTNNTWYDGPNKGSVVSG